VELAYIIVSAASVILWLPIIFRFYKSWIARRNPVSLAICAAILLIMWTALAGIWIVAGSVNHGMVILVSTGMSAAVAMYAHVAFFWSSRRFPDARKPSLGEN
jgi:hypothetical protein